MKPLPDTTAPLNFTRSIEATPAATIEDVQHVIAVLRQAEEFTRPNGKPTEGWLTAQQISEQIDGMTDRKVRKVASAAAPRIVSYPGSPGYKLFDRCTVEEIDHCIKATESQGRDMIKRSVLYRTAYHKRQQLNATARP